MARGGTIPISGLSSIPVMLASPILVPGQIPVSNDSGSKSIPSPWQTKAKF